MSGPFGPDIYAAESALVAHHPRTANYYKSIVRHEKGLAHVTVEVHRCQAESPSPQLSISS